MSPDARQRTHRPSTARPFRIRVALADDHMLFRQALRQLIELEPDIEVVGEALNGWEAQELARKTSPDVFLIDINMPVADGVAATREILREHPAMGVIVLTMYGEDVYLSQALTAGARGYLLKEADADVVVDAIRTVAAGRAHLDLTRPTKVSHQVRRHSQRVGEQPTGLDGL